MHDGRTRKVDTVGPDRTHSFLANHRASLTILRGPAAGTEFELDAIRIILGRGETAQIRIDDASISSEHAAFELDANGFGIRDLASTNHVLVNGTEVLSSALKHGDRVQLGECELQFVIEDREAPTRAWALKDDS